MRQRGKSTGNIQDFKQLGYNKQNEDDSLEDSTHSLSDQVGSDKGQWYDKSAHDEDIY